MFLQQLSNFIDSEYLKLSGPRFGTSNTDQDGNTQVFTCLSDNIPVYISLCVESVFLRNYILKLFSTGSFSIDLPLHALMSHPRSRHISPQYKITYFAHFLVGLNIIIQSVSPVSKSALSSSMCELISPWQISCPVFHDQSYADKATVFSTGCVALLFTEPLLIPLVTSVCGFQQGRLYTSFVQLMLPWLAWKHLVNAKSWPRAKIYDTVINFSIYKTCYCVIGRNYLVWCHMFFIN